MRRALQADCWTWSALTPTPTPTFLLTSLRTYPQTFIICVILLCVWWPTVASPSYFHHPPLKHTRTRFISHTCSLFHSQSLSHQGIERSWQECKPGRVIINTCTLTCCNHAPQVASVPGYGYGFAKCQAQSLTCAVTGVCLQSAVTLLYGRLEDKAMQPQRQAW